MHSSVSSAQYAVRVQRCGNGYRWSSLVYRSAHVSTTLANLHWLRAAERINFQLATLTFRCLLLLADFIRVADVLSCRRLRSSSTNGLIVRSLRLVTVGDRAFPVAGAI